MSRDLHKKYEKETTKDHWAPEIFTSSDGWFSTGSYSNEYVKWLEEKLTKS
jgi:hypothetical protein